MLSFFATSGRESVRATRSCRRLFVASWTSLSTRQQLSCTTDDLAHGVDSCGCIGRWRSHCVHARRVIRTLLHRILQAEDQEEIKLKKREKYKPKYAH